jgi:hypothetical protein
MQAHPLPPPRKRLLHVLGARLVLAVRIARGLGHRRAGEQFQRKRPANPS